MSGTNLEHTMKYELVDDAANTLEGIDTSDFESSFTNPEEIADRASSLEDAAQELESVEFPGMYG